MKSYIIFWLALFVVGNLKAMVLGIDSKCQDPPYFFAVGCGGYQWGYNFDHKTQQCAVINTCGRRRNVWATKEICEENCLPK